MNISIQPVETDLDLIEGLSGGVGAIPGGAIISTQALRKLASSDDPAKELNDLAEAVAEQENLYAMATLSSRVTGIDNLLIYIPVPQGQHGPRIKVAVDPPNKPGGKEATVPFDRGKAASGDIPAALEEQVRRFIALNEIALMEYWRLDISTDEFIARLRPLADAP